MSVDPHLINAPGPQGITQQIADLQRQIDAISQNAFTIPAGGVSGGPTGQIGLLAITHDNIAANTITAGEIAAHTITAGQILANTITSNEIAAHTITAAQIFGATITANELATGSVTASKISVSQLSAIASDMGSVTAGIFSTGSSGARVLMGSSISTSSGTQSGVVGIDASNNITFLLDSATGNVTLKGSLQQGSTGLGNVQGVTQNAILVATGSILNDNPSLDATDITPFILGAAGTRARDTVTYLTAPASLKWINTSTGAVNLSYGKTGGTRITAVAASIYSTSLYVTSNVARTMNLGIGFYNAGGSQIGSALLGSNISMPANQWTRMYAENLTAPASTVTMLPFLTVQGSANTDIYYIDDMLVVNSPTAQGSRIVANSITAAEIAAGTITATQILANTITAGEIASGTITTTQLNATAIDGMTITGATIQTASGAVTRTGLDSSGFFATDSGGSTKMVTIDASNGLRLTQGASGINKITWHLTSASGTQISEITSVAGATASTIQLITRDPTGGAGLSVLASFLSSTSDVGNLITASVFEHTGTTQTTRTVIDGTGASSFMQLPSAQQKIAMSGFGTFTGNGTATVTVSPWSHGLGVAPNCLVMTPFGWVGYCNNNNVTRNTTTFNSISFVNTLGTFTNTVAYFFSYYVSN